MDLSQYSDKELHEALELAGIAKEFTDSRSGKLFEEASKRISERAVRTFALGDILPKDTSGTEMLGFLSRVIELRTVLKKYKYGLFDEIKQLADEEENIYYEFKEREPETRQQATE